MDILKSITSFFRYSPLENPAVPINSPEAYSMFALPTASGIPVTYRACMGLPAIRKGVSLIAGHVAKLPLYVYRTSGDGSRKKDMKHPAYRLLMKSPSPLYSPFIFKRQIVAYTILYGNSYAYIIRDEDGQPEQLLVLDPESTQVKMSKDGQPLYLTKLGGKNYTLPAEDIFHLKDFGDCLVGDGLVHIARDSLGLSLAMMRHSAAYFRNGAAGEKNVILSPILKDLEKRKQFIDEYHKVYSGSDNAYKTKFWMDGTKIESGTDDADKSQLVQSRLHDLIEVADLLCIPPHKLGATSTTSYGSLEQENQAFLDDCLDMWLIMVTQEVEAKLFTEAEKQNDLRSCDFDRSELLRMDSKTERDLLISEFNNGGISWEEYRIARDMLPDKDEEMEWRHPSNIVIEGDEDEPEEPEVPPQAPQAPPMIPPPEQQQPEDKAKAMTKQVVQRLIKRIDKAVENNKTELFEHLRVFTENLSVYPHAEEWSADLLERIETEVKAVLPEQRKEVFSRLDINKELEKLWK